MQKHQNQHWSHTHPDRQKGRQGGNEWVKEYVWRKHDFLCAHWSFMWFYDDILIKAMRHGAGMVIKNIPTPRGVVKGRKTLGEWTNKVKVLDWMWGRICSLFPHPAAAEHRQFTGVFKKHFSILGFAFIGFFFCWKGKVTPSLLTTYKNTPQQKHLERVNLGTKHTSKHPIMKNLPCVCVCV